MRVVITGINFKYDDGFNQEYTGVEIQFVTSGFKVIDNTPVEVSKEDYELNKGDSNKLRALIVEAKLVDIQEYVDELNQYKASLIPVE